jgi:4-hydroxybenzoate polyprenyltransferase
MTRFSVPAPKPKFAGRWLQACADHGAILPLGGACAIAVYARAVTGRVSLPLCVTTFLFIYASYKIDHLAEVGQFDETVCSARSRALSHKTPQIAVAVAAFVLALGLALHFAGLACAALLALFPLAVALYGTPLLGRITSGRLSFERLKDVPHLKALYTSFFWGLLFVFASAFLGTPKDATLAFFFVWMWMRDFVNTAFCDCKDLERDRAEGVSTLMLRLGVPRAMKLLGTINLLSILWLASFVVARLLPLWMLPLALLGIYTQVLLVRAVRLGADVNYLCEVAMDGEFILWLPCAALGLSLMYSCGM